MASHLTEQQQAKIKFKTNKETEFKNILNESTKCCITVEKQNIPLSETLRPLVEGVL